MSIFILYTKRRRAGSDAEEEEGDEDIPDSIDQDLEVIFNSYFYFDHLFISILI